jgi:hypothetical protein
MFKALKNYSFEQISEAANAILRTRKYTKMPTIADFVTAIEGDQEHTDDDRAELQAMAVINEIRRVGSWGKPRFDDPVTADIVRRRFGWDALCQLPVDQTSFFVRDFKAAYMAADRTYKRELLDFERKIDTEIKKLCNGIGG